MNPDFSGVSSYVRSIPRTKNPALKKDFFLLFFLKFSPVGAFYSIEAVDLRQQSHSFK